MLKGWQPKKERCKFYRCGAEAARGAHNPEVTGSKPVAGNPSFPTQFSMILQRKVPLLAVFVTLLKLLSHARGVVATVTRWHYRCSELAMTLLLLRSRATTPRESDFMIWRRRSSGQQEPTALLLNTMHLNHK